MASHFSIQLKFIYSEKILRNLHQLFDWHYIGQMVEISQNFVAFSEYMNFTMYAYHTYCVVCMVRLKKTWGKSVSNFFTYRLDTYYGIF